MAAPPHLETERLVLRPHRREDFPASCALWGNEQVVRFIGGRVSTGEEVWSRLLRYAGLWPFLGYGYLALEDKASGRMIGDVGLADFHRATTPSLGGLPEMGWALHPDFHGRGLAREALGALLDWADGAGLRHTCCIIDPDNGASLRLAAWVGYVPAGTLAYRGTTPTLLERRGPVDLISA